MPVTHHVSTEAVHARAAPSLPSYRQPCLILVSALFFPTFEKKNPESNPRFWRIRNQRKTRGRCGRPSARKTQRMADPLGVHVGMGGGEGMRLADAPCRAPGSAIWRAPSQRPSRAHQFLLPARVSVACPRRRRGWTRAILSTVRGKWGWGRSLAGLLGALPRPSTAAADGRCARSPSLVHCNASISRHVRGGAPVY